MTQRLLLSVADLRTHFAMPDGTVVRAVDGIGFDLHEGETLCIVGESGSGKSVAARSILQIVDLPGRIVGGRILLHRYEAGAATPRQVVDIAQLGRTGPAIRAVRCHDISMIFQEPMSSLSPVHNCGDQIAEAVRLSDPRVGKRAAHTRAVELLGLMQLRSPDLIAKQFPFELSGGMQQRVMIAMALAGNPRILIADEPTTALDVTTQAEILKLIAGLQRQLGLGVIFITHDMGVVANVADTVAVMNKGKIVETNRLRTLFDAPQHPYTRMLLASTLRLESPSPNKTTGAPVATGIAPAEPLLSLRDITKVFGNRQGWLDRVGHQVRAVDGVSFDVGAHENLGIVGESGSGKSTVARCILGLHRLTSGSILYRTELAQTIELSGHRRFAGDPIVRDIRMVFQDPYSSLNPRMSVGQIVAEPLLLNDGLRGGALRERVAELLVLVGLEPRMMERYPHAFSGGQRQRIVIARAIALKPRLVIADEATSALDVSLRAQMLDLLLDLQQQLGLSYILITHDISTIRYFCDRVIVMHNGKVVEQGTTRAVLDAPREPYTQRLIASVPRPDPTMRL